MGNCVSTQRPAIETLLNKYDMADKKLGIKIKKNTKFFLITGQKESDCQEIFFSGVSLGHDRRADFRDQPVAGFSLMKYKVDTNLLNTVGDSCCAVLVRLPEVNDPGYQKQFSQAAVELLEVVSNADDVVVFKKTKKSQCYIKLA